jgi:alkanesulfonate monooxygenase SsuD/methylene tetrahydromethanopterin reductase-like flavin-dependent oxidoreductase (luciferase family)
VIAGATPNAEAHSADLTQRVTHPWVAEGATRVRFAIGDVFLDDWSETVAFVQRAERLGFDSYWAYDHPNRIIDTWTKLAALATATDRIRLISLVSCIFYRSPYLLARQAADVDRISGGRVVLGVGIGDDEPEFRELGVEFLPARKRQEAMEEALDIIQGLWTGKPFTHHGTFFEVSEATMSPGPVQTPHIPILIGGGGERVTLRQVAERADVSNMSPHEWAGSAFSADDVARKYDVLRGHCRDVGRDFNSILRTHYSPLLTLAPDATALEKKRRSTRIPDAELRTVPVFATPEQAVEHYQRLVDVGVQYFLMLVNGHDDETVDLLATAVMPMIKPASGAANR